MVMKTSRHLLKVTDLGTHNKTSSLISEKKTKKVKTFGVWKNIKTDEFLFYQSYCGSSVASEQTSLIKQNHLLLFPLN